MDSFSIKIIVGFCLISLLVILRMFEHLLWWRYTNVHFDKLSPILFQKKWTIPEDQFEKWLNETVIPNDKLEFIIDLDNGEIYFRRKKAARRKFPGQGQTIDFAGKIAITEVAGNNSISLMYRIQPFDLLLWISCFLLMQIFIFSDFNNSFSLTINLFFEFLFAGSALTTFAFEKRRFHDCVLQMISPVKAYLSYQMFPE